MTRRAQSQTKGAGHRPFPDPGWTGLWLGLLCLAASLLPDTVHHALEYRRDAVMAGEFWRLWSCHLVHFSGQQALLDGLVVAVLGWVLSSHGRPALTPLLVLMPLLGLVLFLAAPGLAVYRGASGVAMILTGMLLRRLWIGHPGLRGGLVGLAIVLTGKMLADAAGLEWNLSGLPPGVHVAWQAHGIGLVLGLIQKTADDADMHRLNGA